MDLIGRLHSIVIERPVDGNLADWVDYRSRYNPIEGFLAFKDSRMIAKLQFDPHPLAAFRCNSYT